MYNCFVIPLMNLSYNYLITRIFEYKMTQELRILSATTTLRPRCQGTRPPPPAPSVPTSSNVNSTGLYARRSNGGSSVGSYCII